MPQVPRAAATTPSALLILGFALLLLSTNWAGADSALLHTMPGNPARSPQASMTPAAGMELLQKAPSRSRNAETTDWFTEFFSSDDFNLEYKTLTLTPAANPNGYTAALDSAFQYRVPITGDAVVMALDDDESVAVPLAPNTFPLHGINYATIYVSSNGLITMTGPNVSSNPALVTHFNTPRISVFHADLQPASGGGQGTIYRTSLPDRIVFTFDGVQQFQTSRLNSFQVELFYSGTIRITWLGMETKRAMVGVSKGGGLPSLFFQSNLRLYATSGPFAALPTEPVFFLMQQAGQANPTSYPLTLLRKSGAITTWASSVSQPWLEVVPASGTFGASEIAMTTLRPGPAAAILAPGTYNATASFTLSGTGVSTDVAVRLQVTDNDIDLEITDTIPAADDQSLPFGNVAIDAISQQQVEIANGNVATPFSATGIILDGSYQEDFEDNLAQGWVIRQRVGGENDWRLENGRLLAGPSPLSTGFMEATYSLQKFRDVVVEATIEHTGWDGSFVYIAVRGEPAANGSLVGGSTYLFGISGNNGYTGFRIRDTVVTPILTTSISPSVFRPPFTNRLRVEAVGPVLQFYANDYYMGGVVDASITGAGRIGFVASSVSSIDGVQRPAFAFDGVVVRRIPDGTTNFRLGGLPNFPALIPASGSLAFDAIASPESLSRSMATARILTSNLQRPHIPVFLSSTGTPPAIGTLSITDTVSPPNDLLLDFGAHRVDTTGSESVTVANISPSYPVEIDSIYLMNQTVDTFDDPAVPGWQPSTVSHWSHSDSAYVGNAGGAPDIWMLTSWSQAPFFDGSLTVSVKQTPEDSNSFYVFIRATPDFVLFPDGSASGSAIMLGSNSLGLYNLTCFVDGDFRFLQSWLYTDAIHKDGSENAITLEYIDGRIRAAFNGTDVFEGELPPFIPGGMRAGVFAGAGTQGRSYRLEGAIAESPQLPGPFTMSGTPFFPTDLSSNASLVLPVEFAPVAVGPFGATLRVRSNELLNPLQRLLVAGTGFLIPFDFNNDGIVNVADVTLLGSYVSGRIANLPSDGDVNEDGDVDWADVEALAAQIVE